MQAKIDGTNREGRGMSAAVIAPTEVSSDELQLVKIPINVGTEKLYEGGPIGTLEYWNVFFESLRTLGNSNLSGTSDSDSEWLKFLARAIAKEAKYLLTSSQINDISNPLKRRISNMQNALKSYYAKNGINVILARRGKTDSHFLRNFVDDSLIVLNETTRALTIGFPVFSLHDFYKGPVTIFLYYKVIESIPTYFGHVLVIDSPDHDFLAFISIYKSIFADKEKGFAERVLADVTNHALTTSGKTRIGTYIPLGAMRKLLLKEGFMRYHMNNDFKTLRKDEEGNYFIKDISPKQKGGKRHKTIKKNPKQKWNKTIKQQY